MKNVELMTVRQVSQMFGYSQTSIKTKFNRTAEAIKKKYGVQLYKVIKPGQKEPYYEIYKDERALTIYEQSGFEFPITYESLTYDAYELFIFLTLTAHEQGVWRGTPQDLLRYMCVKNTTKNVKDLKQVIQKLTDKKVIESHYQQKKVVLYLVESVEDELTITIPMLQQCKKIADMRGKGKNNFSKISQMIRVWEAIRICEKNQPFTSKEISQLTGLSYKQVLSVKKMLEENCSFKTKRAFLEMGEGQWNCIGSEVELNGFYEPIPKRCKQPELMEIY